MLLETRLQSFIANFFGDFEKQDIDVVVYKNKCTGPIFDLTILYITKKVARVRPRTKLGSGKTCGSSFLIPTVQCNSACNQRVGTH